MIPHSNSFRRITSHFLLLVLLCVHVVLPVGAALAYGYDASGNRSKVIDASAGQSSTTRYKDNALHQYTAITTSGGANTYAANQQFDERGNLALVEGSVSGQSSAIGKTRYFYDDANNLVSAVRQDAQGINQSKTEFGYDAFRRRRLARSSTWTNNAWQVVPGSERRYLYDGMQIVQERDENNALLVSNVWESDGGAVAGLLSRTVHGQGGAADASYYYHYDGNGNVVQLTDASGAEVARYRYDAFGNTLEARGAQAQANPYRFSTKRYEAAVGAYDFGFRFYIASQGRFLTRDPFGESGGINLYRYVDNSPTNSVDPLGLAPNIDWGEVTRGLKDGAIDEIKSLIPPPPWEIPGMLWNAIQQAKWLFEKIKEEGFDICKLKAALGMLGEVGDIIDTLWDAYNAYQRGDSYALGQKVGKLMAKGVLVAAGAGIAKGLGSVLKNKGPSKGVGCGNSFAAGTLVLMGNGSLKPIEDVQTGDEVLSKDEKTGKVEKKRVTSKIESANTVLALTLSNGETLLVTDEHPLYVEGLGFREAAQAGIGTSIVTRAGPSVQVVKVEQREGTVAVYNFSVADFETFFVGKDALWVHNSTTNCRINQYGPTTGEGHWSVEVDHAGGTTHTEQIIGSSDKSKTSIEVFESDGNPVTSTVDVDLPNPEAAAAHQKKVLGTQLGPYHLGRNSCLSHVADVLRAGGADVGPGLRGTVAILKRGGQ